METIDTSGFYYNDNGYIICALNYVYGPYDQFKLVRAEKDTYTYPIGGWYWFDSEEQAYNFFDVPWSPDCFTQGLEHLKPQNIPSQSLDNA